MGQATNIEMPRKETGETTIRALTFKKRFISFVIVAKAHQWRTVMLSNSFSSRPFTKVLRKGDIWGEKKRKFYRAKTLRMSIHMSKRFATLRKIYHSVFKSAIQIQCVLNTFQLKELIHTQLYFNVISTLFHLKYTAIKTYCSTFHSRGNVYFLTVDGSIRH